MTDRHVLLLVLDGWGYSAVFEGNAIAKAHTPSFDRLWHDYPHTLLQAAGEAVGLPWGEMGNSEVGHLNMGAGRVVAQNLPRISAAIADGSFMDNKTFLSACEHAKTNGSTLHLVGLASSGGVHSHIRHLITLLKMAKQQNVRDVAVHAFTDGRDAPVKAGLSQIGKLEGEMRELGVGRIASLSGRYYAMDRDKHWDRTKLAYGAIVRGEGPSAATASEAIEAAYAQDITDEFILPCVIGSPDQTAAPWSNQDAVVFFNFRSDRIRQLTEAAVLDNFESLDRGPNPPTGPHVVTMTEYKKSLPVHVAFPPQNVDDSLARVVSDAGVRQFHIAETEKYPHATFFFNGGYEEPNPLEERLLVPSPKVATYDLEPPMSVAKITDELIDRLHGGEYRFIMANFANADMVGHSGNFAATVKAVEAIDRQLSRLQDACEKTDTTWLITADHGNAEEMINGMTGEIDTEHTTNPVPFIMVIPTKEKASITLDEDKLTLKSHQTPTGLLGDVAPTVLKLLDIPTPNGMAGYGLF